MKRVSIALSTFFILSLSMLANAKADFKCSQEVHLKTSRILLPDVELWSDKPIVVQAASEEEARQELSRKVELNFLDCLEFKRDYVHSNVEFSCEKSELVCESVGGEIH